jgi:hypothetical protein
MDTQEAKRKRKELKKAKQVQLGHADTNDKRKYITKEFKRAFRSVKRSERNQYKRDIKREFGI